MAYNVVARGGGQSEGVEENHYAVPHAFPYPNSFQPASTITGENHYAVPHAFPHSNSFQPASVSTGEYVNY